MWNYTKWSNDSKPIVIVNIFKKTPPSSGRFKFYFVLQTISFIIKLTMPLRNYMIAHKEKKYFHPQKHIAHLIKKIAGLLILMQCINKLYLSCYFMRSRRDSLLGRVHWLLIRWSLEATQCWCKFARSTWMLTAISESNLLWWLAN